MPPTLNAATLDSLTEAISVAKNETIDPLPAVATSLLKLPKVDKPRT
jgi:hypothetical protein